MLIYFFIQNIEANTNYISPSTDGHEFFMIRDARSHVSGSWLSQTSQSFVVGSTSYFFNNVDLAGTYKDHRFQISTLLQGNEGTLLGGGPIIIGDKWLLQDAQQENTGLAVLIDSILPIYFSSSNKDEISQPFGIHLGFAYDTEFVSFGRTILNSGIRQDLGLDSNASRNTTLYASIGQGLWSKTKENHTKQYISFENSVTKNLNSTASSNLLLSGISYLHDTADELQFRTGLFLHRSKFGDISDIGLQASIQITWDTSEEMGRRIGKWEIYETRCTNIEATNCPDSDEDGISDFFDLCPVHAEIINGLQDEDGCPEYGVEANINDIYTEIYQNDTLVYQSQTEGLNTYDDKAYSELMSRTELLNANQNTEGEQQDTTENQNSIPTSIMSKDATSRQMAVALEIVVADLEYISETLDHDGDGINDITDLCRHRPEDIDGFEDLDGCPDEDNDQDGIFDGQDECPLFMGDAPYGCPDERFRTEDGDLDGIKNSEDICPDEPETINAYEDNDGCPDTIPDELQKIVGRLDTLQFEIGNAILKENSIPVLQEIQKKLQQLPEYKLRIEGHTDDIGTKESNDLLSQQRADSVLNWLVEHQIDAERLMAQGFGSSKPLASNTTREGQERNRRVEIYLYKEQSASIPEK